jgi:hypothetical protein
MYLPFEEDLALSLKELEFFDKLEFPLCKNDLHQFCNWPAGSGEDFFQYI